METPTFDPEPRLSRLHPDLQREILRAREQQSKAWRHFPGELALAFVVPLVAYFGFSFFGAKPTTQLAALIFASTFAILRYVYVWSVKITTNADVAISISEWMALNLNKEKL